jgi:hypothetical protein
MKPRILVIKLGALGDFAQAFGPFRGDQGASSGRRDHAANDTALRTFGPAGALV